MLFLTLNDDLLQMVYEYLLFTDMYRLRLTCKDGNRLFRKVGLRIFRKRIDEYLQAGIEGASLESALEESNFGVTQSIISINLRNLDFLYDTYFSFKNRTSPCKSTWWGLEWFLNFEKKTDVTPYLKALGWKLFFNYHSSPRLLAGEACYTPESIRGFSIHLRMWSCACNFDYHPVILLSKKEIQLNDDKFHLRQTI